MCKNPTEDNAPYCSLACEAANNREPECRFCRKYFFGIGSTCPDCAEQIIDVYCDSCDCPFEVSIDYKGKKLCQQCTGTGAAQGKTSAPLAGTGKDFCLSCERSPRKCCVDCYMESAQYDDAGRLRLPSTLHMMRQGYLLEDAWYANHK